MSKTAINLTYIQVSGTNSGGGIEIFKELSSINTLNFKTLVAGDNISLSAGTDTIIISGSSNGGGNFVTNTKFNGYTGTTAPATYQSKSSINTLTGTTLPNTYQSKSSINTLTGTTLPNTYQSKTSINTYTGTTAPNQFANRTTFNTYTGTTAPATYQSKTSINTYTGTTQPVIDSAVTGGTSLSGNAIFLDKIGRNLRFKGLVAGSGIALTPTSSGITITSFSTGSTAAGGSNKQVQFNTGGALDGSPNLIYDATTGLTTNILKISTLPINGTLDDNLLIRNTSTGVINKISTSTITGLLTSNNGITKSGNNYRLGGILTGATIITSPATGSRLSFAGFPVQYSADYSASYNVRSLVDRGHVTGITSTLVPLSTYNTYITTTAPATYQSKTSINTYTGTTAPAQFASKVNFNTHTGTTINTANNGLTKSGTNVRLGGALTGNTTISGGGINLTFSNNAWTFGSRAAGTVGSGSFSVGDSNIAAGSYSLTIGQYGHSSGTASFVGGIGDSTFKLISSGLVSFNFSQNTAAQTFGHGALASNSVILGGTNHNIEAGNTGAVIVGRNGTTGIKLTGSAYIDHTAVNNLAIWTAPVAGAAGTDDVLVWNSTDKKVKKVTQASLSGGGGSPAGSTGHIQIRSASGTFGSSANFTFATGTSTLATSNLTLASVPSVGTLSDNILIRNTGSGLVQTIPTSSINALLTSNNGITKSGNNFRLGGALTGTTTISGAFSINFNNNAWTFGTSSGAIFASNNSIAGGSSATATGNSSIAYGTSARAYGGNAMAFGYSTFANGAASFAGGNGFGSLGSIGGNPTTSGIRSIYANGTGSFNWSTNTILQVVAHGALANQSAILGGRDNNIEVGNVGAAIIGGNGIKLTGASYSYTTAVSQLAIMTAPSFGISADDVLVRSSTTGLIRRVTQASLSGGGTAGSNTQIQYNNSGVFGASNNLVFNSSNLSFSHGGRGVASTGTSSVVLGTTNTASAVASLSFGSGNNVSGGYGVAIGQANTVTQLNGVAIGNSNTVASGGGNGAVAIGESCNASNQGSVAIGSFATANNTFAFASNRNTTASGSGSFASGVLTTASGSYSKTGGAGSNAGGSKPILASAIATFNHSFNDGSQTVGHGALANYSAILGGVNHNIANSSNDRAVIIGGNAIKLTSGYADHVAVANLAIFTTPSAGGADDVLTWNSTSKKIGMVTQASISDIRLKSDIVELTNVLEKIDGLSTIEFKYNEKNHISLSGTNDYGLIAQEVENIFPHVVKNNLKIDNDETEYKTVDYRKLVPILFAAIKELNLKIQELESKIQ